MKFTRIKKTSANKPSKYRNKKVVNEYGTFDSNKEFKRYIVLLDMQNKGEISDLQRQVEYEIIPTQYETITKQLKTKTKEIKRVKERATHYKLDYRYIKDGVLVAEDVKASRDFQDPVYKIKRKLMLYVHGIEIKEIY